MTQGNAPGGPAPAPAGKTDATADPNPLTGIALKVASVAVLMLLSGSVKALEGAVPPGEVVFFRSLLALPPIVIWLMIRGDFPGALATRRPVGHALRSLAGTGAMSMMFVALSLLPLTEVIAITYAAPLFITLFAAALLGERIRLYRMTAVAVGFAGVLLVMWPRLTLLGGAEGAATDPAAADHALGAVVALGAAVMMGLAQTQVRGLSKVETTAAIVFWFTLSSTILALFTLPFGWIMPTPWQLALLVTGGLAGGVGQIMLTAAYRYAEAGVIAPFEYTSMILAVAVGWFVFGEAPTLLVLAGAGLVTAGGILIIWRERQLGLERNASRRAKLPPIG